MRSRGYSESGHRQEAGQSLFHLLLDAAHQRAHAPRVEAKAGEAPREHEFGAAAHQGRPVLALLHHNPVYNFSSIIRARTMWEEATMAAVGAAPAVATAAASRQHLVLLLSLQRDLTFWDILTKTSQIRIPNFVVQLRHASSPGFGLTTLLNPSAARLPGGRGGNDDLDLLRGFWGGALFSLRAFTFALGQDAGGRGDYQNQHQNQACRCLKLPGCHGVGVALLLSDEAVKVYFEQLWV